MFGVLQENGRKLKVLEAERSKTEHKPVPIPKQNNIKPIKAIQYYMIPQQTDEKSLMVPQGESYVA